MIFYEKSVYISRISSSNSSWVSTYWWDSEFNTIWWKLYTPAQALNWACPTWWHLPSSWEIQELLGSWLWCNSTITYNDTWQCDDLWWWWHEAYLSNQWENLAVLLNMPLAGDRSTDTILYSRGITTHLWLASAESRMLLNYLQYWVNFNTQYTDYGYSVRCLKN